MFSTTWYICCDQYKTRTKGTRLLVDFRDSVLSVANQRSGTGASSQTRTYTNEHSRAKAAIRLRFTVPSRSLLGRKRKMQSTTTSILASPPMKRSPYYCSLCQRFGLRSDAVLQILCRWTRLCPDLLDGGVAILPVQHATLLLYLLPCRRAAVKSVLLKKNRKNTSTTFSKNAPTVFPSQNCSLPIHPSASFHV